MKHSQMPVLIGKKVLVIGGSGFIGSNLIERLNNMGCATISVDIHKPQFLECRPHRFYYADIRNQEDLTKIFVKESPDIVFHLAAVSTVDSGNKMPVYTLAVNGYGTQNVLKAIEEVQKRTGKKVVLCLSSTDKVMKALPVGCAYNELTPICPAYRCTYDIGKAIEELIVCDFASEGNLTVVFRQSNILGIRDLTPTRILPALCRSIVYNEPFTIRRCKLPDGSVSDFYRTYLYIEDLIDAYIDAVSHLLHHPLPEYGGLWCIAPSRNNAVSVTEFVERVARQFGRQFNELNIRYSEVVIGQEILSQLIDASKFKRDFGWSPATDLDEMLRNIVPWYEKTYSEEKNWAEKGIKVNCA